MSLAMPDPYESVRIPFQRTEYLPTSPAIYLQMLGTVLTDPATPAVITAVSSGLTRLIDVITTGYSRRHHPRYVPPRAAAERTMSRRRAAGTRRTKHHGLRKAGPKPRYTGDPDDSPFGPITGYDLFLMNKFR